MDEFGGVYLVDGLVVGNALRSSGAGGLACAHAACHDAQGGEGLTVCRDASTSNKQVRILWRNKGAVRYIGWLVKVYTHLACALACVDIYWVDAARDAIFVLQC